MSKELCRCALHNRQACAARELQSGFWVSQSKIVSTNPLRAGASRARWTQARSARDSLAIAPAPFFATAARRRRILRDRCRGREAPRLLLGVLRFHRAVHGDLDAFGPGFDDEVVAVEHARNHPLEQAA